MRSPEEELEGAVGRDEEGLLGLVTEFFSEYTEL
jgi:hypothetical protein